MAGDLHIHTHYSDGSFSPAEIVEMAAEVDLSTIAIADHDTVAGLDEAIIAGEKAGIEVIPAMEFSTFRGKAEIHILGYYLDYQNRILLDKIDEIFRARIERAQRMVYLLQKEGIEIDWKDVKKMAGDDYVGRPHLARVMVKKGYIAEMGEAFTDQYIGNGGRAYVEKYKLSPREGIDLIKEADGLPVLAHPVFINHGQPLKKGDIQELVEEGLKGLEVFHSKQDDEDSRYYQQVAQQLDLLVTGGSDFHGENSPGVKLGDIKLDQKYIKDLKKAVDGVEKKK